MTRTRTAWSLVRRGVGGILITLFLLIAILAGVAALLWATAPSPRPALGWSLDAELPEARGESTGAVLTVDGSEQLAVVGGLRGLVAKASQSVDFYDPNSNRWRPGPPLPEPRHHLAAAGVDGTLFVAGGAASSSDWTPRREVWQLKQGGSTWEALAPLPEGRYGHRLAVVDKVIYLIGGVGGAAVLRLNSQSVEQGWTSGADLPRPRDHLGTVVVNGEIWAIGGRDGGGITNRVDIYDPKQNLWRPGPELPEPTSAAAVGFLDGWIVVSGGEDPRVVGSVIDRHWRLRPGGDRWEPAPSAPLAVHGAADGVVQGRLLIAGGASRHGLLSPLDWTRLTQSLDIPAPEPPR